ncbi:hypothetical protein HJFPF1_01251 [Paramyrothecium foliicola]|nr:hypothetical protein HJFPF1_01251 [Paramyrothecium foliicola]
MATQKVASPADITKAEFSELLDQYPALIEAISQARPAKDGQQTLQQLDRFRYVDAVESFGQPAPNKRLMSLEDVKRLVEWKLRHGKFRPTLMSLVSSNSPELTQQIIRDALEVYRGRSDVPASIATLTKLKGIGPATASLLLTVHYPAQVIFFSDEAFHWLCCGGKKSTIKYNAKEYNALRLKADEMMEALSVSATDIEKVAYVVMKRSEHPVGQEGPAAAEKTDAARQLTSQAAAKRKSRSVSDAAQLTSLSFRGSRSRNRTLLNDMPALSSTGSSPLPPRFAQIKHELIQGKEDAIRASWARLLVALQVEIERVSRLGADIIPFINYEDINNDARVHDLTARLRQCGVAVIRGVVPEHLAIQWRNETKTYLFDNQQAGSSVGSEPDVEAVYWSPGQVKCRAHPNVLAAQRFLMKTWHSADPDALVSTNFPVVYADRLRTKRDGDLNTHANAYIDGDSVERWEYDGYGSANAYNDVWAGHWEHYDPWESSSRLKTPSDLRDGGENGTMFRMFQGWMSLSTPYRSNSALLVCPMIQLSTAYLLLRPFFVPRNSDRQHAGYLSPDNWQLEMPPSAVLHGATPSYNQELNDFLHPHLRLDESMVPVPALGPGDYVIWHSDAIYAFDHAASHIPKPEATTTAMYLPVSPLTETNAIYLARQRKAFVLGLPGPDFGSDDGESFHMSRAGTQDVHDAGGDEGLRAMGLQPWNEDEAGDEAEATLIEVANAILFPDMYE